jgi:hypothetical protein
MNTHDVPPPSWLAAKTRNNSLTYRQYNQERFEPWMKRAYAPSVTPFFEGPPQNFLPYLTPDLVYIREELRLCVQQTAARTLPNLMEFEELPELMRRWHRSSVREREELCLLVFERLQRRAEMIGFLFRRVECPELTLDFARDPFKLEMLFAAIILERDSGVPYRLPPSPVWERMHDVNASGLPASRAVRAFTEEGRLSRALFLSKFAIGMLKALVCPSLSFPPSYKHS